MADLKEARVPDIGHADVPVIEVLVKVGDRVEKEQSLITLESDKATMEVPAPFAGTVKELKLKVGDEVSEGAVIALIEAELRAPAADEPKPKRRCPGTCSRRAAAPPAEKKPRTEQESRAMPSRQRAGEPNVLRMRRAPAGRRPPSMPSPDDAPYASPAVRAFARELGVDIQQVKGSGRGGRIQRDDVRPT